MGSSGGYVGSSGWVLWTMLGRAERSIMDDISVTNFVALMRGNDCTARVARFNPILIRVGDRLENVLRRNELKVRTTMSHHRNRLHHQRMLWKLCKEKKKKRMKGEISP